MKDRTVGLSFLIIFIGFVVSTAFIALGVRGALNDQELRIEKQASDLVRSVETTWSDYKLAASWVHETCRLEGDHTKTYESSTTLSSPSVSSLKLCSRRDFRALYEYLVANGLEFNFISFIPNVTDDFRAAMEAESRAYYSESWPMYSGFTKVTNYTSEMGGPLFGPMPKRPFYFPKHLIEPFAGNELLTSFSKSSADG